MSEWWNVDSDFTPFEQAVLRGLLVGEHAVLATLRSQLASATVTERTFTVPGCFVDIGVDPRAERVEPSSFYLSDVHLELDACEHGAAAILFVNDGRICLLEMVAYMEGWSKIPSLRCIWYLSEQGPLPSRDMQSFAESLELGHTRTLRG